MIAYKYRLGRGTKDSEGRDVFERDIELLSRDTIYIPTVEQLNDPAEALVDDSAFKTQMKLLKPFASENVVSQVEDRMQSLYDSVRLSGVYSLSKVITNELMWAYYANGHNGYAIIIDTDVLANSYEKGKYGGMYEIDVKYSSKLPRFDISKIHKGIEETLACLEGTKSKAWEHEAEHRLIFDKGGRCLKIDYRAIKGFVFGCRMNGNDIDYIMKMFSGRDFEYYKVELKNNSYTLSLTKLKDKYPSTEKYCPNKVEYNIGMLLDVDKCCEGVGYKYRHYVEEALCEVSREPFVRAISHIVVSDDKKYPHILIWTDINQDGVFKKRRSYEYDIVDGSLVKVLG